MTYGEVFTALADPTRRRIFESLREEPRSVGELARQQPVSRPAVSQHLRILESAGLVTAERMGTRRVYSIDRGGLNALRDYLDTFWSDALTAYAQRIAKLSDSPKR